MFEPLDILAELTQHIPNQGEHLIRYYGCYTNQARRRKAGGIDAATRGRGDAAMGIGGAGQEVEEKEERPTNAEDKALRRRWAKLIKHIYQVDPLVCPKCGGLMKIIGLIEAPQGEVIRKILEHCGPWRPPPAARPPPRPPAVGRVRPRGGPAGAARYGEVRDLDRDFLEHLHREAQGEQLELWD